jgi:hypothetical protein
MSALNRIPPRSFQVLFKDSSEYFEIHNARMFTEGGLLRFVKFDLDGNHIEDIYYPLINVYRIKTLPQ